MVRKTKAPEVCPKCEGTGYLLAEGGAAPCDCLKHAQVEQAYRLARIPRKFMGKSLSNFEARKTKHKEILSNVRHLLQTFRGDIKQHSGKGLLLMGLEGTGKTHVAVALLKEVIAKGYTGLYWNVPELFLELRRIMNEPTATFEADIVDQAMRADLLVLDDLGAERSSDYVNERLYVLINGRYQNDTATIITTNRNLDELRSQLGPRIVSRIAEMCVLVEFPEGDYRRQHLS